MMIKKHRLFNSLNGGKGQRDRFKMIFQESRILLSLKLTVHPSKNGWLEDDGFLYGVASLAGANPFREGSTCPDLRFH